MTGIWEGGSRRSVLLFFLISVIIFKLFFSSPLIPLFSFLMVAYLCNPFITRVGFS